LSILKRFFESPSLAGLLAAVALAVSFSPRMSTLATWLFLTLAWIFGVVGIAGELRKRGSLHLRIVAACLTLLLAGALYSIGHWLTKQPEIVVVPEAVSFSDTIASENYTFIVMNKTDDNLYTVEALFRFEPQERFHDFNLEVPESSKKPIADNAELADIAGLTGTYYDHRPCLLLVIYKLGPHEQREISFTHKRQSQSTIESRIEYFTEIPQPRADDPLKLLGSNLHVKEGLTLDGEGFIIPLHEKSIKSITINLTIMHAH